MATGRLLNEGMMVLTINRAEAQMVVIALEGLAEVLKKDVETPAFNQHEDKAFMYSQMGAVYTLLFSITGDYDRDDKSKVDDFLNL
jgi:hypothetical protein